MTASSNNELVSHWIEDVADVVALSQRVRGAAVMAVDTEADSFHSYYHRLCLVQVSSRGVHALLDPLRLGARGLAPLVEVLQDRKCLKVFHGADYDLRTLDRDLGARVCGLADTHIAAQLVGERHTGLARLLEKELGVRLNKALQRANWAVRPLSAAHRSYAAADTAYLEALLERLQARLRVLGRLSWWQEECQALEQVRFEPPRPDPFAFERIKGAQALNGEARDRLAALYGWRERVAAGADVAPFKILGTDAMLRLAREVPANLTALAKVPGVGRASVHRWGVQLLNLLRQAPPAPQRPRAPRPPVDRVFEARVKAARAARDKRAQELDLEPGVLAPRERLEQVVRSLPGDIDALTHCLGRRWRAQACGQALLGLTSQWRAASAAPP